MGKIARFFCGVLCFVILIGIFLQSVNKFYDKKISSKYYDAIGETYGNTDKDQGLALQEKAVDRGDNLLIFGSSELGSILPPFYPVNFFKGKKDGFQVNMIGRGYSQSIIHAVNIGALGKDLKNKKVVIILSPQWFAPSGLSPANFNMNFSELQFYDFMFDKGVDKSLKLRMADRIRHLAGENQEFGNVKTFSDLYAANNIFSKAALGLLTPYYRFKYYLLSIKDKMTADKVLKGYSGYPENETPKQSLFNWDQEKASAAEAGKAQSTNNKFGIENGYYELYIQGKEESYKGQYSNLSYLDSPEYDDFRLLLDICKSQGVKPLIVSVPVHGDWYDYSGSDKNSRQEYYKKIKDIVASYGFDIADFSQYEYEDYFLKDIMHLGWKGWVYFDEAVDKYYHKNQ